MAFWSWSPFDDAEGNDAAEAYQATLASPAVKPASPHDLAVGVKRRYRWKPVRLRISPKGGVTMAS